MKLIDYVSKLPGGQAELAARINAPRPDVSKWCRGGRPVPLRRCCVIERATQGEVRRWDLRPEDWHRIWPELIGTEGAPNIPQEIAHG